MIRRFICKRFMHYFYAIVLIGSLKFKFKFKNPSLFKLWYIFCSLDLIKKQKRKIFFQNPALFKFGYWFDAETDLSLLSILNYKKTISGLQRSRVRSPLLLNFLRTFCWQNIFPVMFRNRYYLLLLSPSIKECVLRVGRGGEGRIQVLIYVNLFVISSVKGLIHKSCVHPKIKGQTKDIFKKKNHNRLLLP